MFKPAFAQSLKLSRHIDVHQYAADECLRLAAWPHATAWAEISQHANVVHKRPIMTKPNGHVCWTLCQVSTCAAVESQGDLAKQHAAGGMLVTCV